MIVGICGLAGSGKDTAADFLVKNEGYVKIAFADPLKRIARDVYDFTDEQLWGDSKFRNMPDRRYPRRADYWVYPHCPVGAVWLPLYNQRGFVLVDVEDVEDVVKYRWTLNKKEVGKNTDYARATIEGKKVSLHTFLTPGAEGTVVVDHINGNGLDNRKRNLRVCSKAENQRNAEKRKDGESVFKGVGRAPTGGWRAFIKLKDKLKTIGTYATEEEAALAYDTEAVAVFGKFARLNSDRFLTPRFALQQLGTEWGRTCYPNTWADLALRTAKKVLYQSGILRSVFFNYDAREGLTTSSTPIGPKPRGVVISDVRFINEVVAINEAGGFVYQTTRGTGLEGAAGQHQSEIEMRSIPQELFKGQINNKDWTLEELEFHMNWLASHHMKETA